MVNRAASYRWLFLGAVALVAAAVGDACVESIANGGVFGTGYRDDDHLSVVPAMVGGGALLLEVLLLRCCERLRGATRSLRRDWLVDAAADLAGRSPLRDLPVVASMQFAALFAMESTEQVLATGRLAGGVAWLGGPPLFAVAAHLALALAFTLLLGRAMRAVAGTVAALVRRAIAFVWFALVPRAAQPARSRRRGGTRARAQAPHVREIGGRAPPLPAFASFT